MLNKILLTPVDQLVDLVKKNKNTTITSIQNNLKLPKEVIEKWLVILEEYKILYVNYHGFEGYVTYIESDEKITNTSVEDKIDIDKIKEIFLRKCQLRKFSEKEIVSLWPKFVLGYENQIKEMFMEMAKKKGFKVEIMENAWASYKKELVRL